MQKKHSDRTEVESENAVNKPRGVSASFAKRHNRLLAICGAMIVFATFIVKEGIRERLKDRIDAVHAAETVYAIREDNVRIANTRVNVEWRALKGDTSADKNSSRISQDRKEREIDLLDETDDALNSSFGSLFGLERAARAFDAKDVPDLASEHKTQEDLDDLYQSMIAGDLTDDDYLQPSKTDQHDAQVFVKFENDAIFNLTRSDLIAANIQEKIKDKIEQNERYLSIANVLSYIFYVLGWCLGLMGRIVGVDGLTAD